MDYVSDPRTGTIVEFPMGLPNVGQIKELCDRVQRRQEVLARPAVVAKPFEPPPVKPGQITAKEFFELVAAGKTKARPIGAFEPGGYLGSKGNE